MTSPFEVPLARAPDVGRVEYGEVFTRRWVVELILDLCSYSADRDLTALRVVEPSVGSGAFLGPIVDRLVAAKTKHADSMPWPALGDCIQAWDVQAEHVTVCRQLVTDLLVQAGCPPADAELLAARWLRSGDFLLSDSNGRADLVAGNPPYIRIEDLPAGLLQAYRSSCATMGGRSDIFVGFYERALDLLAPGGKLGFICADRWMRNAYGRSLRRKIVDGPFSVDCVLTMHDVAAFHSQVSAYPAITVLSRRRQGPAVTALANHAFGPGDAEWFSAWVSAQETNTLDLPTVSGALFPRWHRSDDSWPEGTPQTLEWLDDLVARFPMLEDCETQTKIGIGVATGADAVYVRAEGDLPDVEPDRLLKLARSADIKSGEFRWTGGYLINPWNADGLSDLSRYPRLAAYYHSRLAILKARNVARKSEACWYRTIDRVNFALLDRPMLVLEDLKAEAHPVMVPAGYYPHHNLYFIISEGWDLEALGGLLLSEVVERQVAAYCVKMRGGTLRFEAQYLRRIRCPRPGDIRAETLASLATAFRSRDRAAATEAALRAYGMTAMPA